MRILLIRLRQIGDVVFTTPAVHAIRDRFPGARIAYLVEPAALAVVAGNPHIDDVIAAPRGEGFASEVALARRLRAGGYDLVIDFHGGPRASTLAWLTGAPERVGYDVPGRGWMYTKRVARVRTPVGHHSVLNQWALLDAIGISPPTPETYPVEMTPAPRVEENVRTRLANAGVHAGNCVIVMHVSAGNPFRRWPAASFAAVAAALAEHSADRRVIITSGPSDQDAAATVIADARRRLPDATRHRVVACGEFSLAELRALVDRAALYIGGDSGPMHVAATSHVAMVTLYGPTLPERSSPWRPARWPVAAVEVGGLACRPCDQRRCEPGDFRCLTRIDPQQVIDASERVLAGAAVQ